MIPTLIAFLGRVCISFIFIALGIHILLDWQGAEQSFIGILCDWLTITMDYPGMQVWIEKAMSMSDFLMSVGVFCLIAGSLLVLLGFSLRLGAFLLLLFFIPTTILFHHFWTLQGTERETQLCLFIKNVSIIGGLLLLLAYGRMKKKAAPKESK